jgi:DNA modification methylase
MPKKTKTSSFGVSKRECHDSSNFYSRNIYNGLPEIFSNPAPEAQVKAPGATLINWVDQIYCQSSENLPLPDSSVALAFTSPPYSVGKDYDGDMSLEDYLGLIQSVAREVYRVLIPGGRYIINIANLGRKPYLPLHAYFYNIHMLTGFLPMGEIIWQKGKGASGNCAWGSWKSARSPRLRDIHEYLLVFAKDSYSRPERGESDLSSEEFMQATLSVWNISPASAKKVGHPAPFPVELAERVIKLYSYKGDVVLDPFNGAGTTCVAAKQTERHYVGVDISPEYCQLSRTRIEKLAGSVP